MTAIEILLEGLIDYAGLYPPAGLDMHSAVRSYLNYRQGEHPHALGRFVVDLNRIEALCKAAGDSIREMPLSVIIPPASDWGIPAGLVEAGLRLEMVEIKPAQASDVARLSQAFPAGTAACFEVPFDGQASALLDAIFTAGKCAKLRMGGIVGEAFPPATDVACMLKALAERRIPFKATAGLHHPVRSCQRLTYEAASLTTTMHGFVNVACAAMLLYFGGEANQAESLLNEENAAAFAVTNDAIEWRSFKWSKDQVRDMREHYLNSIGSCSFQEPLRDLEALGWL